MRNQWKALVFLGILAAAAALAGGMVRAFRKESPVPVTVTDSDRLHPPQSSTGEPTEEPDAGATTREDSPWGKFFGGGNTDRSKRRKGGGLFGGAEKDVRPDYRAEFSIAESTKRIEYISASVGLPTSGEWRGRPAVGDFDGDGNLDLVVSVRKADGLHVFYGDGRGTWEERGEPFQKNLGYGGSDVGDFNKDGFLDLVFSTHGAPAQVFLGDGNAGWTRSTEGCENRQILQDVAVSDFDNDENLDFVGIGWAHGGVYGVFGNGQGQWETVNVVPGHELFGHEIVAGDVNGDGNQDFVVTMGGPRVFLGGGDRTFKPANRNLPVPPTKGTNFGIALGDVTGDGTLEIAVAMTAMEGMRGLAVYDQKDNGTWTSISVGLPLDTSFLEAEMADLDNDGKVDLIAYTAHNILIWRGDGGKSWTPAGHIGNLGRAGDLGVGDVNGDGFADIIAVYRHSKGGVEAFLKR